VKFSAEKKESSAIKIADALSALPNGSVFMFEQGEYHIFSNECKKAKYYFTNSDSEIGDELSGITYLNKNLAVFLKDKEDIVIDGGNSLFLVHGEMTPILIDNCKNVTVKNLSVDYVRATVSEMLITEVAEKCFIVRVNTDSPFSVKDDKLSWVGDTFSASADETRILDKKEGSVLKSPENFTAYRAEHLGGSLVKFHFPRNSSGKTSFRAELKAGRILEVKNSLRTQAGVFITNSENIVFENSNMHFMHGGGVIAQCCKNLTFKDLDFVPREKTGRNVAAFAEFFNLNALRGKLRIENCRFSGCMEDGILMHGTGLKVSQLVNEDTLFLEFKNPRTLGFNVLKRHDKIAFAKKSHPENKIEAVVEECKLINSKTLSVTLFDPIPNGVKKGMMCDDIFAHPETVIAGNTFKNIAGENHGH
jgi:hypothetical protein